jgi:trk system potassium uptake protein TrkA
LTLCLLIGAIDPRTVTSMHTIVVGCGRLGAELAQTLQTDGGTVAVIDKNPKAFARLEDFDGTTVVGFGFDHDTLASAGVDRADALAAVTSGDNSNIVVARLAKEHYQVDRVVARIQDPARAEIYHRLGIPTVAAVKWTTDQVVRRLAPDLRSTEWTDANGEIALIDVGAPDGWAGRTVGELDDADAWRIVAVNRAGHSSLTAANTVIQGGDRVYLAVRLGADESLTEILGTAAAGSQS